MMTLMMSEHDGGGGANLVRISRQVAYLLLCLFVEAKKLFLSLTTLMNKNIYDIILSGNVHQGIALIRIVYLLSMRV
jgi:hypothetical protein